MSIQRKKSHGEGGVHGHKLKDRLSTLKDGLHKHLFFIFGRLLMTELDGPHWHPVDVDTNEVKVEIEPNHAHVLQIRTQEGVQLFTTEPGTPHNHELQTDGTTVSGLHIHVIELNGERFVSLLPGDLITEIQASLKSHPALKNFKITSKNPLETNFKLIKRLNKSDFKPILRKAVTRSIIKSLTNLAGGLQIRSLVLSRERFVDIGQARRFVMDHGLNVKASEERERSFIFQILSDDKFQEPTLQRVRITEGVEAVVGFLKDEELLSGSDLEGRPEDTLTENAVQSDRSTEMSTDSLDSMGDNVGNFGELQNQLDSICDNYEDKKINKKKNKKSDKKRTGLFFDILKTDTEQRLVTGPLLIPEIEDLQEDIISIEEIEKAAHDYMIKLSFQGDPDFLKSVGLNSKSQRGFMHVEFDRRIALVESFLAPVDFELNGRLVRKGTWIVTVKVFDDEIWSLIKTGKITGFSIGGRSRQTIENVED